MLQIDLDRPGWWGGRHDGSGLLVDDDGLHLWWGWWWCRQCCCVNRFSDDLLHVVDQLSDVHLLVVWMDFFQTSQELVHHLCHINSLCSLLDYELCNRFQIFALVASVVARIHGCC